jgi:hypothetical protein
VLFSIILICSVLVTPDMRDCTQENATTVMRVPVEFGNAITCLMRGQAVLAQTSIGRALGRDERVRITCAKQLGHLSNSNGSIAEGDGR